jgi:predicted amidophosphoribosyltransferase
MAQKQFDALLKLWFRESGRQEVLRECGVRLNVRCPNCGSKNSAISKFCGDCGRSLNSSSPAPRGRTASPKHLA